MYRNAIKHCISKDRGNDGQLPRWYILGQKHFGKTSMEKILKNRHHCPKKGIPVPTIVFIESITCPPVYHRPYVLHISWMKPNPSAIVQWFQKVKQVSMMEHMTAGLKQPGLRGVISSICACMLSVLIACSILKNRQSNPLNISQQTLDGSDWKVIRSRFCLDAECWSFWSDQGAAKVSGIYDLKYKVD